MKITEVTTRTFLHPTTSSHDDLGHPIRGPAHDVYESLLTIGTDEGAAGYSFGASPNLVDQVIAPMLVGNDPFDRERLWQRMAISQGMIRDFHPQELAAVDLALWDLAGRYLGQPIHKLLGAYRDKVPAYASSPLGTFGGGALDTPEAYAELAAACVKRGFKGFKLHTWFPSGPDQELDPKRDVEACQAVRDAVGPDIDLMLDCWHFYSREHALYIGRELDRLGYYWFEEPMDEYSMSSYQWLAEQLDTPILGPERAQGNHRVRAEWIKAEACDIVRVALGHEGGLTPAMKTVHLAESFGMAAEPHGPADQCVHLCGATAAAKYLEVGSNPSWEWTTPPWLKSDITLMDADGYVPMPRGPGSGLEIDFDYIDDHAVDPPATLRLQRQK
ncbi:MAG: enolase [Spirochaetaceae bacterium]|nr:enolase [Spirochaetaceae bacterium]